MLQPQKKEQKIHHLEMLLFASGIFINVNKKRNLF